MACLGVGGFEFYPGATDSGLLGSNGGDIEYDHGGGPLPTFVAGRTGTGVRFTSGSGGSGGVGLPYLGGLASGRTLFGRIYLRFSATPVQERIVLVFGGTTTAHYVRVSAARKLQLTDQAFAQIGLSTTVLALDTWYRVEVAQKVGAAGTGLVALRVAPDEDLAEAELVASQAKTVVDAIPYFLVGAESGLGNVDYDDWQFNDDTAPAGFSAGQPGACDTYPGPGSNYLLDPLSDESVGSGWARAAGGALYQALDNRPPDTTETTDYDQNSTNDNAYDIRLESFEAAGVDSSTIIVAQPTFILGQPSPASSSWRLSGVSNPAAGETAETQAVADTAVARRSQIAHLPAVDRALGPVVRARRDGAGTVRLVGAGMYVATGVARGGLSMLVG